MIEEFAQNLWVAEDEKFSVGGLQIGSRMTIIRLNDGDLFVHSPIALLKIIKDSIDSIGKPKFIIAPNTMHHTFLKRFYDQYPEAELYIVPGLRKKRHDLSFAKELSGGTTYPWNDEIKQHHVKGIPKLEEVVFFHAESRTLILTDLAFYITPDKPFFTRLFFSLNGVYDKFGPSRIFKNFLLKDTSEFKKSVEYILTWDFERIIISHGKLIGRDGKAIFTDAFSIV
ncbi:MAG: DUF4336 domain-containing protein [Candidatus Dadabacteria bacterium]|nr:DUF4336 domain-containing protein [Candidatus Dadabacteria bacterium]